MYVHTVDSHTHLHIGTRVHAHLVVRPASPGRKGYLPQLAQII